MRIYFCFVVILQLILAGSVSLGDSTIDGPNVSNFYQPIYYLSVNHNKSLRSISLRSNVVTTVQNDIQSQLRWLPAFLWNVKETALVWECPCLPLPVWIINVPNMWWRQWKCGKLQRGIYEFGRVQSNISQVRGFPKKTSSDAPRVEGILLWYSEKLGWGHHEWKTYQALMQAASANIIMYNMIHLFE